MSTTTAAYEIIDSVIKHKILPTVNVINRNIPDELKINISKLEQFPMFINKKEVDDTLKEVYDAVLELRNRLQYINSFFR